jgi:hypothetical protein
MLEPSRAAEVAARLPVGFLADVAVELKTATTARYKRSSTSFASRSAAPTP